MIQFTKTRLLLLIFLGASFITHAQFTQVLRGSIVDQVLQTPISNATIYLDGIEKFTISDANGNFSFADVPAGTHKLLVEHKSFKNAVVPNIVVNSGKETVLVIQLESKIKEDQELIIKSTGRKGRPLNDMSAVSARSFSVEETTKYAAAVNDVSRMATNFAGVVSSSDGNNHIAIRGNSPTALLWRMEGIDIPNPNHFASAGSSGGGISILSAQLLANSDFVTGAFAAEYGNAVGGVFDLRLRKGNNKKREYTLQAGVLGINVAAEGPINLFKKGSYVVNYRYSTLGLLSNLGVNLGDANTNFQDLSYNFYLPTKRLGNFSVFGFGGLSSQSNKAKKDSLKWVDASERYVGVFKGNTGMSGISHSILLSKKIFLKSAVAYSLNLNNFNNDYINNNYEITNDYAEKFTTKRATFSTVANIKANTKNTLRLGAYVNDINYNFLQKAKENPTAPLLTNINVKGSTQTIQGFAQWQNKAIDKFTFNMGIHYFQLPLNNSNSIEPRASVKYDANAKTSIAFGYGLHSQMQGLGVYFAESKNAANQTVLKNKNLDLTKSHHFVLGYNYLLAKNLKLKVEAYYQHLFQVPISTADSNTFSTLNIIGDYITDPLVNKGKGKNYGLEVSLEKQLSNNVYFMWSNSFYQAKYTAADKIERNTRFNGNYVTNVVAGKEIISANKLRTYGLNIKFVYAGGFRNTPINLQESRDQGKTIYFDKQAFSLQNPAYYRADIRASITWNKKNFTSTLSLDLQNATNRLNVFAQFYDPLKDKIITVNQTGLIPILNYKIEF